MDENDLHMFDLQEEIISRVLNERLRASAARGEIETTVAQPAFAQAREASAGKPNGDVTDSCGQTARSETRHFSVPFPVQFPWKCDECSFSSQSLLGVENHPKVHGCKISFRCTKQDCPKAGAKMGGRGVAIHYSKCRPGVVGPAPSFKCLECGKLFRTRRGVSQHERHRHPGRRNALRVIAPSVEALIKHEKRRLKKQFSLSCAFDQGANLAKEWDDEAQGDWIDVEQETPQGTSPAEGGVHSESEREMEVDEPFPESLASDSQRSAFVKNLLDEDATNTLRGDVWREVLLLLDREDIPKERVHEISVEALGTIQQGTRGVRLRKRTGERYDRKRKRGKKVKERAVKYRTTQYGFSRNTSQLAKSILDNESNVHCQIPLSVIQEEYTRRFGSKGLPQDKVLTGEWPGILPKEYDGLLVDIAPESVRKKVCSLKEGTAAGPDGISKRDVLKWDPHGVKLAALCTLWLRVKSLPPAMKECRTTLIPKGEKGLDKIGNWRPITIGQLITRIYSAILEGRLRAGIQLSDRQRGFIPAPGCEENLSILEQALTAAKGVKGMTSFVALDLAKAFDTVSHDHIIRSLRDQSVPEQFVDVVTDLYSNASTNFTSRQTGDQVKVPICRGVRQGDPLSPLLFNLCIDPLIRRLDDLRVGIDLGEGQVVTVLGFADDLFVIARGAEGMNSVLQEANRFVQETGLQFNVGKCAGFTIHQSRKTWTVGDDVYRLYNAETGEQEPIPVVGPEGQTKYLGMRVSPWTCIQGREPMEHLQGMIRRIGEAPLKSFQKVHLLKVYAIPRLTYSLVTPTPVSLNRLCALDSLIRTTVKEWLNLPACTTSCLLYCRIRDGGLALPWLTRAIPVAQMKRLQRLMGNRDKVLSTVGKLATVKRHYRQQSQIVKLQGGKSFRKQAFREWMSKGPQGFGVETYQDNPQSHEAISVFAKDLRDYEKQQILKMRANVYPTREFLTRGTTDGCHCRHCGGGTKEDFFHIVTSCSATKQIRIQRHDLVVEILSDFLVQES